MLLNYKYLVLTCIDEDITTFKNNIVGLLSEITQFPRNWTVEETGLIFKEIYFPSPPSGGSHLMNFLIWEPLNAKGTTVFYINYEDGWASFVELYSKKFSKKCIQVGISGREIKYPMFKFSYITNNNHRIIICYKDNDKWEFFQKGELLPFENESYYLKYKIKDRLPGELVIKYLKESGWDIQENTFWQTTKSAYNFKRLQWD